MYNKMNMNGYEKYKEQHVMQASPQELILMVYDCCIKNLKLGRMHIEENACDKANNALQKSQDCINELIMGLDFEYEISKNLLSIYEFLMSQMIQINLEKNGALIQPLMDILTELREAWAEAARINRVAQFTGGEM